MINRQTDREVSLCCAGEKITEEKQLYNVYIHMDRTETITRSRQKHKQIQTDRRMKWSRER